MYSGLMDFFLNGAELSLSSANSGNLKSHCSMNWGLTYMCLVGTVVASWSLRQEVADSSPVK